jgi:hypothetical protein
MLPYWTSIGPRSTAPPFIRGAPVMSITVPKAFVGTSVPEFTQRLPVLTLLFASRQSAVLLPQTRKLRRGP